MNTLTNIREKFNSSLVAKARENEESVEITEGFDVPAIDYNKLKDYKGFQDINIKKMIKANGFSKFNAKTVQDVIVWLNFIAMQWKADNLKEEVEIDESVSVDMRTKGYKEAIARNLLRKEKKEKKEKKDASLKCANKSLTGKNENMSAGGSDATGDIAGKDMPLGNIKRRKPFK